LYASDPARIAQLHQRDTDIEDALMTALERWEQLSSPA
jgi:ATP-binding cassette subfamily F protein uup